MSTVTPQYTFQSITSGSCGNSSLLEYQGSVLILDAGIGIRAFLKHLNNYAINPRKLAGILITHDHADHLRGAVAIAHQFCLPIYTTPEVCRVIRSNPFYKKDVTAYLREREAYDSFDVNGCTISFFDIPHDATRNVGITISSEAGIFSLMTDIGMVTPTITEVIRTTNYLVFESNYDEELLINGPYSDLLKQRILSDSGHISNQSASQTLVDSFHEELRFLALCHLSGENNTPSLALSTLNDAFFRKGYVTPPINAHVLERKKTSPIFTLKR